jgi:hypothetical protein
LFDIVSSLRLPAVLRSIVLRTSSMQGHGSIHRVRGLSLSPPSIRTAPALGLR